jgi:glutamate--cysteine ligase
MPAPRPQLTLDDASTYVRDHVFGTASSAPLPDDVARHSVGIELEWLTTLGAATDRLRVEVAEAVVADAAPLPGGSRVTVEPGGQLELSSARFDRLTDVLAATGTDLYLLDRACGRRGVALIALGADPVRSPERVLTAPRYVAMEEFFDAEGRAGRTMMCNTASIQLNIGLGPPGQTAARWELANALCPTLIATFANSPLAEGGPSGWQSTRQRAWWMLDASRAAPPRRGGDPAAAWLDYALAARVMLIRGPGSGGHVPVTGRLPFGRWLAEGHELGWPTLDDFAYHLTTLFPPVRPRGWFELRVLDALPTPFWQVAALLVHTLLTDASIAAEARRAVAGTEDLWVDAAQLGLGHPALARAARALFDLAGDALEHGTDDEPAVAAFAAYRDRWVRRARTPGDDRLDAWRRTGALVPRTGSPFDYAGDLLVELDR